MLNEWKAPSAVRSGRGLTVDLKFGFEGIAENGGKVEARSFGFLIEPRGDRDILSDGSHDKCYDWLISLGYEMSDDEIALREGTCEWFRPEEKK